MSSLPWYLAVWSFPNGAPWRIAWLRRTFCLLTLVLLATTWRLWVPQQKFPPVPLLTDAEATPWILQAGSLMLAALGLFLALVDRDEGRSWRAGLVVFAGSMLMLWVIDQHRLQPWAYQAFFWALMLATCEPGRATALLRLFTVSIYVFSACSKFDYTFLHSLGQQFTQTLLQLVGLSSADWTDSQRVFAALLFPLGELAVALLLTVRHTQLIGIVAAIVMHVLLLLVLGPWGMNQQPAVLVWNVEFIVLTWLLFGGKSQGDPSAAIAQHGGVASAALRPALRPTWPTLAVEGLLVLAICAPLLEPFGWCDHWLAWGLYAPGASRAQVFVRGNDVQHLPAVWREYIEQGDEAVIWRRVYLDRWSLEVLHVPLYPQARFQLGVALAVAHALPPGQDVRVELFSAANRFTGEREQTSLQTRPQLEEAAKAYWVNALPAE